MKKVETIISNGEEYQVHRTWLKVILNPLLTKFGWIIVSVIDDESNDFIQYEMRRYPEDCSGPFKVWFKL